MLLTTLPLQFGINHQRSSRQIAFLKQHAVDEDSRCTTHTDDLAKTQVIADLLCDPRAGAIPIELLQVET